MWAKAIIPGAVWTKETFPEFPDVSVTTDSALAAVLSFSFFQLQLTQPA